MLAASSIVAEDVNLCVKCDRKIAGHPPGTCGLVPKELNELFRSKRAEFKEDHKKHEPAFNKSAVEMGSSLKKIVKCRMEIELYFLLLFSKNKTNNNNVIIKSRCIVISFC